MYKKNTTRRSHTRKSKLGNVHNVRSHAVEYGSDNESHNLMGAVLPRRSTRAGVCKYCGLEVFFFKDENGGFAVFDELGSPWSKHGCYSQLEFYPDVKTSTGGFDIKSYAIYDVKFDERNLRVVRLSFSENDALRYIEFFMPKGIKLLTEYGVIIFMKSGKKGKKETFFSIVVENEKNVSSFEFRPLFDMPFVSTDRELVFRNFHDIISNESSNRFKVSIYEIQLYNNCLKYLLMENPFIHCAPNFVRFKKQILSYMRSISECIAKVYDDNDIIQDKKLFYKKNVFSQGNYYRRNVDIKIPMAVSRELFDEIRELEIEIELKVNNFYLEMSYILGLDGSNLPKSDKRSKFYNSHTAFNMIFFFTSCNDSK